VSFDRAGVGHPSRDGVASYLSIHNLINVRLSTRLINDKIDSTYVRINDKIDSIYVGITDQVRIKCLDI
jgi:hypothetical protein